VDMKHNVSFAQLGARHIPKTYIKARRYVLEIKNLQRASTAIWENYLKRDCVGRK